MNKCYKHVTAGAKFKRVTKEEWEEEKRKEIKIWHFEICTCGLKPVVGKYDQNNPDHIPIEKIIKFW
jgi:hypothetical protein